MKGSAEAASAAAAARAPEKRQTLDAQEQAGAAGVWIRHVPCVPLVSEPRYSRTCKQDVNVTFCCEPGLHAIYY